MSTGTVHLLKASFNGGEMTPLLDARVDIEKHATGCRILENMIPRSYGGVMKRPGTEFIASTKDGGAAVLIGFRKATQVRYMLEFGDGYLRVWDAAGERYEAEGAYVTGPEAWSLTGAGSSSPWSSTALGGSGTYDIGDKVVSTVGGGATYICTTAHTPDAAVNRPGDGSSWSDYWTKYYFEAGEFTLVGSDHYICVEEYSPHSATFATTADKWSLITALQIEFPTPYSAAEVFGLQFCQINDVLFLAHPNHFPRRLSFKTTRDSHTWTIALENVPFEFAPALDVNETQTAVQVMWDPAGMPNWTPSTAYAAGDRVLGITGAYDQDLFTCHTAHTSSLAGTGAGKNEPGIGNDWSAKWNQGTSRAVIPAWAGAISYPAGKKVRYQNVVYECSVAHTSNAAYPPGYGLYWTRYWRISSGDGDLSGLTLQLVASEEVFSLNDVGSTWILSLAPTSLSLNLTLPASAQTINPTKPLFMQGPFILRTAWTTNAAPNGGSLVLEESLDGVTWARLRAWSLVAATDGNISYEGEAPTKGAWYRVRGSYSLNTGADQLVMEPASAVLRLPFKIEAHSSEKVVTGKFIMPNDQLPPAQVLGVSTTVYRRPAFIAASQGFPRAVTFHDSRLWWGGTAAQPARIWGSALDDYYIYLTGANEDDGIDVTLASTEANAIQWITSQNRQMIIGTTGEEWTLDSGETDEVLTPAKIRARRRTRYGSEGIAPVLISDALLWAQRGGKKLRELAYRFESDSYTAPEMTLLAEHLFRSTRIVQMAYQATPDPIVWCVADDGVLYGFSYDREQQVTAWHRHHIPDHFFESVAVIYGDDGADQVWFVVMHYEGEAEVRELIRFHPETQSAALLDTLQEDGMSSSVCYVDKAAQTDLSHLEGSTVTAAGETTGGVVTVLTGEVSEGEVPFSAALPAGHWIGLPIPSRIRPMKLEIPLRNGTALDQRWRLTKASLNLIASCGGTISPGYEVAGDAIDYQGKAQPYSGQLEYPQEVAGNWGGHLDLYIEHSDPTPFNLIAAILQVEVSTS